MTKIQEIQDTIYENMLIYYIYSFRDFYLFVYI